jgi:hypothetical protein
MNSIINTHFDVSCCGTDTCHAALCRLGSYLDGERDRLEGVLAQSGRAFASEALDALGQLHLEPDATDEDLRNLLEEAKSCVEYLLENVRGIPARGRLATAYGLPGPEAFDRHVRWSGARLEDLLATLKHALAS